MYLTRYMMAVGAVTLGLSFALMAMGQTPTRNELRDLLPNQTLERELTGAEVHRYKFNLNKEEFLQVRVEQKGVDVSLSLLNASGQVMATMDSPNSKEGPEILSFVAQQAGDFVLEVSGADAKAEKGDFSIRREAPRRATERDKRRVDVERLFIEGVTRNKKGQSETAIAKLKEALEGWRELEDTYLIRLTERQLKTIELIAELRAPNSLNAEGNKLIREGRRDSVLAARAKFIASLDAARKFFNRLDEEDLNDIVTKDVRADLKVNAKMDGLNALTSIRNTHDALGDWQESVNYSRQALSVIREMQQDPEIVTSKAFASYPIPIKAIEASTFSGISSTFTGRLDKPHEGLSHGNQAVTLWREVQREHEKYRPYAEYQEALTLQTMAQSYVSLDDRKKAIEYFEQALTIFRRLPDQKNSAALILQQIGNVHSRQLDYGRARGAWDEALKIYEELGAKTEQVSVLGALGLSYFTVNDEQKAREYFNRQLAILLSDDYMKFAMKQREGMSLPDHQGQPANVSVLHKDQFDWERSVSIGGIYTLLGEVEKGREYYAKSLVSARAMGNQNAIRLSLSFIGSTFERQEKWQEVRDYYQQTLEISRLLPGKSDLAGDLSTLAFVNIQMKRWQDALQNASEALLIYQSLGADKNNLFVGYAGALNMLARAQDGLGNRRLAIFYEKQAVNAIQRERQQLRNLDQQAQRGYLKKNEKPYRRLAEWLIAEGRIVEAEQVLEMLKEDELFDYVRRNDKVAEELKRKIKLSTPEEEAFRRYEEIADQITTIGKEYAELEKESKNHPVGQFPRQARLAELDEQLTASRKVFSKFLEDLEATFRNKVTKESDVRVAQVSGTKSLLDDLNQPRTVIISTIAGEDRLNIIVTTAKVNRAHTVDIKAEELNKLVTEFRAAVKDPKVNPRPAGKRLYDQLFPPDLQKDLEGVKPDTIAWSLDGTLRYAPIAALWDGKQYLGQKYVNVVITLASRDNLKDTPSNRKNWTALGAGVSKPFGSFPGLPAVPKELCSVVNDPRKVVLCTQLTEGKGGLLGGVNLPDEEFTLSAFKLHLGRYPIVHIASHFSLNAGTETDSYLLLGGGTKDEERKLTLAAVRDELDTKFRGVELLTLSACNTAMSAGEKANGVEIEGFGALAQKQGTKAVLATLWSVADESTQLLMSEFYRLLKERSHLTKGEGLQRAQQEMITGRLKSLKVKGERRDTSEADEGTATDYSHPYYWSPFVLIGNWQ